MGSFLSIVNDTTDTWQVSCGSDEAAIQIVTITGSVLASVAAIVVSAGAAAPFAAALGANGVVTVLGVSTAGLAAFTAAAASLPGVIASAATAAGWASTMVVLIQNNLVTKNAMTTLAPGQSKTFGPMATSLWQQGTCIRTRVNPGNSQEVLVETMYMRPIFSGGTSNSTLHHKIQWWMDKWGKVESSQIIRRA